MGHPLPPSALLRTSFLIPNIHCASCTIFIDDLLSHLRPAPNNVDSSIVNRTVTLDHVAGLSAKTVSRALGAAGYTVARTESPLQDGEKPLPKNGPSFLAVTWSCLAQWHPRKLVMDETVIQQRHVEHCAQCRAEKENTEARGSPLASSRNVPQTELSSGYNWHNFARGFAVSRLRVRERHELQFLRQQD